MLNLINSTPRAAYSSPNFSSILSKGLSPVRRWLNGLEIRNAEWAHLLCQTIPTQCPFERDICLLGRTVHIPPMCKLNPLYEEVVSLRFRALCYLADDCGEDVCRYC